MIFKKQRNLLWNPKNGNIKGRSGFSGHIVPKKSKKKFPCRVVTNQMELLRMGYTPSGKLVGQNDYDINEEVKMVA
jgi:YD repeat-containing protein